MSKQYNNAGRSLIVDEVIELKGRKDSVAAFKQQLDAQLLKRDTAYIRAQVAIIASDNYISVHEKNILKRELGHLAAAHAIIYANAEEIGITHQLAFTNYLDAYQALSSYLGPILDDMNTESEIESHHEMIELFDEVYSTSSVIEEQFFRYTTGMIGGLDYRVKFEVLVKSSLGQAIPQDNTPTTLTVILMKEDEDVTDEYDSSAFTWGRVTGYVEGDAEWESERNTTGKSITVSYDDLVNGVASFICRFRYQYSDTMYYAKTGFITLSKEVPGPKGEDAVSVQILSTNGNVFRPNQADTTMIATVFRGTEDITDTIDAVNFNWERFSGDPVADDSWNTSSKATGRKSIIITNEDVTGRAVFTCHVDIQGV